MFSLGDLRFVLCAWAFFNLNHPQINEVGKSNHME